MENSARIMTRRDSEDLMQLYLWSPNGHGPLSFMVVAESEEAARAAVDAHIEATHPARPGHEPIERAGWPKEYALEVYASGVVAEHQND